MKSTILLLSFLCALTAAWPAAAERGGRSRGDEQAQREQGRDREKARYERREDDKHRGRGREELSHEQREQLRRDISDHGREIYRERRERK